MPAKSSNSVANLLFLLLLPILFTLIIFVGYTQAKEQYHEAGVRALDKQLHTVFRIISIFNNQVKEGGLSAEEAEEKVKDSLSGPMLADGSRDLSTSDITLGEGDYLFIFDSKGTLVMHPQLEGQNLFNSSNEEGRFLVKQVLSQGNSTITYPWKDAQDSEPQIKIAVTRYYPQWDWYVCITTLQDNFFTQFNLIRNLLIFLVVGSYIITFILFTLTRRKEKALRHSTNLGQQLAETNRSILKTLAVALEERDAYTSGHSQRVAYYMKVTAQKMGHSDEMLDTLYTGGLLHDIGKIGIEDSVLLKPGRLTRDEYEVIKSHPLRGESLLRKLYLHVGSHDQDKVDAILAITRGHHERYDGTGYPDQLKGEEIPLLARIAAVADSFDAMTSNRAYRKGLSLSKAFDEIERNKGTQFCPVVADAFFESITEETFYHAHQITRANELLFEKVADQQSTVQPITQPAPM